MEVARCPKTVKCPIFSGVLKGTEYTETYKKLYCEAGEEGRTHRPRLAAARAAAAGDPARRSRGLGSLPRPTRNRP